MTNNKYVITGLYLCFAILAYFPLFLHLENLPLRIFDESRLGINALELLDNGNWLVPHYNGQPDMWNLKPPLMVWLQASLLPIFDYDVLALRLPSALFGAACLLLLLVYGSKRLQSPLLGLAMSTSLLCTPGFIAIHVTRTGEYDAMLCFFLLAQALSFFEFLRCEGRSKNIALYCFGAAFSLAVLCKGIAGCFLLPGLFLASLLAGKLGKILTSARSYIVAALAWLPILAYYLGREMTNPGYCRAVWENEIGGRYAQVIEYHQGPWTYYLEQMGSWQWAPWLWWLPLAAWGIWAWEKDAKRRALTLFAGMQSLGLLVLLSLAQTKLSWYLAPSLPLLAIPLGIGFYALFSIMAKVAEIQQIPVKGIWGLVFLAIVIWGRPYARILNEVYHPIDQETYADKMRYGPFLKTLNLEPAVPYQVPREAYNSHLEFYQKALIKKGIILTPTTWHPKDLKTDAQVILCELKAKEFVHAHYQSEQLMAAEGCELILIKGLIKPKARVAVE